MRTFVSAGLCVCTAFLACRSPKSANSASERTATVQVEVFAKEQANSTYLLTISGNSMETIGPDEYQGGRTIEIYVPPGKNRVFRFERYNSSGELTDSGTTVTDIGSGMNDVAVSLVTATPQTSSTTTSIDPIIPVTTTSLAATTTVQDTGTGSTTTSSASATTSSQSATTTTSVAATTSSPSTTTSAAPATTTSSSAPSTTTTSVASTDIDPADAVLHAYEGAKGSWGSWSGKDYANLTISNSGWERGSEPWSGSGDAGMVVKAAYDTDALYLYVEVTDNSFVEPREGWQWDKVDVFLDCQSSAAIYSQDPIEVYCYPSQWQMTYSAAMFQVAIGGASAPSTFEYNHYDDALWSMQHNTVSASDAVSDMDGFGFEITSAGAGKKAQIWTIPWSQVGAGVSGVPQEGTRFAFTVGYNDLDGDNLDENAVNCLRWLNQSDPFTASPDSAKAWGDIHIGP